MDDTSKILAKKLASLMEEYNISQSQLSKDTGIQQSTISNMLPGINDEKKLREPGYKTIIILAKYFDVSADWLMGLSPFRSTNKDNRIAAMTTGLSDRAISELKKLNHSDESPINLNALILDRERIDAIEAFLGTEEGKNALTQIWHFLACDFTKFYTDRVAEEGDDFLPYNHSIGFKMNKAYVSNSYLFVGPEDFEYATLARINEAMRELKKTIYNGDNDSKKKVNQAKKKEGK